MPVKPCDRSHDPAETKKSYYYGEYNPYLEANTTLNKKIEELEKVIRELAHFRDRFISSERRWREVAEALERKRAIRVIGKKNEQDGAAYVVPILSIEEGSQGVVVTVLMGKE